MIICVTALQKWTLLLLFFDCFIFQSLGSKDATSFKLQMNNINNSKLFQNTLPVTIGDICQLSRRPVFHENMTMYLACAKPTNDTLLWPWQDIGIWSIYNCGKDALFNPWRGICDKLVTMEQQVGKKTSLRRISNKEKSVMRLSNGQCVCPSSVNIVICPCPGTGIGRPGVPGGPEIGPGAPGVTPPPVDTKPRPCPFIPPYANDAKPDGMCSWMMAPLAPNPGSYNSYLQCVPQPDYLYCGKWTVKACAPNTVFSASAQVCVFLDDEKGPRVPISPTPPSVPYPIPPTVPVPPMPPAPPVPAPPIPGIPYPPSGPLPPSSVPTLPDGSICGVGIFVGWCNYQMQCPGLSQCMVLPIGGMTNTGVYPMPPPPEVSGIYPSTSTAYITPAGTVFLDLQTRTRSASERAYNESSFKFKYKPHSDLIYFTHDADSTTEKMKSPTKSYACCHSRKDVFTDVPFSFH
ncbi:Microtubule-actin cross-linking factor [Trichinella spiralis]|uniref:Microtubule-actin cross-linking factor n=1 Tax=Trichinella spiralis TaxID=6334 RepID=A0ABR3K9X5_TRISP